MKKQEIDMIVEVLKENLHLEPMNGERVKVHPFIHKKDFSKIALKILTKLKTETLDRGKVNSIIVKLVNNYNKTFAGGFDAVSWRYDKRWKAINQICQLQPKNQVVIAEGEIRNNLVGGITLFNNDEYTFVIDIVSEKLLKHKGKKVKLILEEE